MKVGIVVDGDAEYFSLPILLRKIKKSHELSPVIKADIQPLSTPERIARSMRAPLILLNQRDVQLPIVLLDKEQSDRCPIEFAQRVCEEIARECNRIGLRPAEVVLKNAQFENWLIADTEGIMTLRKRFKFHKGAIGRIRQVGADGVNGHKLLSDSAQADSYSKVRDAMSIMKVADPYSIGSNSRSFRRFMRVLGCPEYVMQSKKPNC